MYQEYLQDETHNSFSTIFSRKDTYVKYFSPFIWWVMILLLFKIFIIYDLLFFLLLWWDYRFYIVVFVEINKWFMILLWFLWVLLSNVVVFMDTSKKKIVNVDVFFIVLLLYLLSNVVDFVDTIIRFLVMLMF